MGFTNWCAQYAKRTVYARFFRIVIFMMPNPTYKAYILRVWQVNRDEKQVLVASLEDSRTNQHMAFASLSALLAFLEQEVQKDNLEVELQHQAIS